jgi:hypothetical protein
MADDKRREANERLKKFGAMSLDDVAVEAALNPGSSVHSQVAEVEIRRRVAEAQIEAAKAQKDATLPLKRTARATVVLAVATVVLAVATMILALLTLATYSLP